MNIWLILQAYKCVPNVPCGVERKVLKGRAKKLPFVPNVPCGVESK